MALGLLCNERSIPGMLTVTVHGSLCHLGSVVTARIRVWCGTYERQVEVSKEGREENDSVRPGLASLRCKACLFGMFRFVEHFVLHFSVSGVPSCQSCALCSLCL